MTTFLALDVRLLGPKIRPCLWGRKRTFVGEFCVKQHLLREVSAASTEICLARRHFCTLAWTALAAFWALDVGFGTPKLRPILRDTETDLSKHLGVYQCSVAKLVSRREGW